MSISRRQFLRACMYAAPAALVAPKAISYFLPPRIITFDWHDYGRFEEQCFAEFSQACKDLRKLLLNTIGSSPKEFAVTPERYVKIVQGMQAYGHLLYTDERVDTQNVLLMGVPVVPVVGLDAVLLART